MYRTKCFHFHEVRLRIGKIYVNYCDLGVNFISELILLCEFDICERSVIICF